MTTLDLSTANHPFLELWRTYAAAERAFERIASKCDTFEDEKDPEFQRRGREMTDAEDAILDTPAEDALGALVKLWVVWSCEGGRRSQTDVDAPDADYDIVALRGALDALEHQLGVPSSRLEHGGLRRIVDLALRAPVAA